eukprot:Rmarinus@m.29818
MAGPVALREVTNVAGPGPEKKTTSRKKKTVEETYQKVTQLEHVLLRPDSYIGSTEKFTQPMWVLDEGGELVFKNITFVPGLFKIFDEILVNAADNKIRDPSMDTLRVDIDQESNVITVYNNGDGIPVVMHEKEKMYVPELIFGHLLTSSNYDDDEKKVTGGRNGYGAKLANIFSTEFTVETFDSKRQKKYKQVFRNNMQTKGEPAISAKEGKGDFTKITFKPDLSRFGMTHLDEDIVSLMKKRVYDVAGTCAGLKVKLDGETVPVRNFKAYCELYLQKRPEEPRIHFKANDRWEVMISLSEGQFQQVSFVNSINTIKGGCHVEHIASQITSKLMEQVGKKNKAAPVKAFQIKNHLSLFVNCLVENPAFSSQTKETLITPQSKFGSSCHLPDDVLKKVMKSGVIDRILSWAKHKQSVELKKTDGGKVARLTGIPKLDDANEAGTKNAYKCTLILTEGDSAKALAVSGLSVVGRDYYGVFPLRGKLLNVREASFDSIQKNQEIQNLKKILGLQQGKVYESVKTLRYGRVMVMADQDHDGSHIKGLVMNMFHHFWPSLLQIPGFFVEFVTPIVKAIKGPKTSSFFTIPEYELWKDEHHDGKGWKIKYYKGLGTSTSQEAKEYFSDIGTHKIDFKWEGPEDNDAIQLAFSKERADDRKQWLGTYEAGTHVDHSQTELTYTDFVNKELILFSRADCVRSIPSLVDGLKPGQRKILFSCFKRKLKDEIKVAQLSGYVSEHSAYHHGEASLMQTIVSMAHDFVGTNNINLLLPKGQFGTRLQGGKDAASARYIFTSLSPLTRKLYPEVDDNLLSYLNEDGQRIEPEWYAPILPMVLVNGADGIGTGWSTSVPNFSPVDLVNNLKRLINGEQPVLMDPWYKGFEGETLRTGAEKYLIKGKWERVEGTNTLRITELPLKRWTQDYKEFLESMLKLNESSSGIVKEYREYHTDTSVHFDVTLTDEAATLFDAPAELVKKFKLNSQLSTTNMVLFDKEGQIKKFDSAEKILEAFFELRLEYYNKRKVFLDQKLEQELVRLSEKARFILYVVEGKIVVSNRKKTDLISDLESHGFKPISQTAQSKRDDEEGDDVTSSSTSSSKGSWDYLLSMPIWSLTKEKIDELCKERDEKKSELELLRVTSPETMWESDLDSFLAEYEAFENAQAAEEQMAVKKAKANSKRKNKRGGAASDDDDDDEWVPTKAKKKAVTKPRALPAPQPPKPAVSSVPVKAKTTTVPVETNTVSDGESGDENTLPLAERMALARKGMSAIAKPKASTLKKAPQPEPVVSPVEDDAAVSEATIDLAEEISKPSTKKTVAKKTASTGKTAGAAKKSQQPRKLAASKKSKKVVESDDDDDFVDDDVASVGGDDDVVSPPAKARTRAPPRRAATKRIVIDDSDESDEEAALSDASSADSFGDESDEEFEPTPEKKKPAPKAKVTKGVSGKAAPQPKKSAIAKPK